MKCVAIPKVEGQVYISQCDNCEDKDATRSRGFGIYFQEICDTCYLRYIMEKP